MYKLNIIKLITVIYSSYVSISQKMFNALHILMD